MDLSENQKKVLIGAAAITTLGLAIYATQKAAPATEKTEEKTEEKKEETPKEEAKKEPIIKKKTTIRTGRRYMIGGNWKSNGTVSFVKDLTENVLNKMDFDVSNIDVVVMPQAHHLPLCKEIVSDKIGLACQNVSANKKGAFTGEIFAEAVADIGIEYALAGHSERRHTLKYETDADVAIKSKRILEAGMTPIVCIGETKAQRDLKQTNEVTARQL